MNPQQLAFAWCKMRQIFNEPINHHMLAVIFHECNERTNEDCPPSWEFCLVYAENLIKEFHARQLDESRRNRVAPQPPAEMLACIRSYYVEPVSA